MTREPFIIPLVLAAALALSAGTAPASDEELPWYVFEPEAVEPSLGVLVRANVAGFLASPNLLESERLSFGAGLGFRRFGFVVSTKTSEYFTRSYFAQAERDGEQRWPVYLHLAYDVAASQPTGLTNCYFLAGWGGQEMVDHDMRYRALGLGIQMTFLAFSVGAELKWNRINDVSADPRDFYAFGARIELGGWWKVPIIR